jgi:small-conductance mechanosensitive channel
MARFDVAPVRGRLDGRTILAQETPPDFEGLFGKLMDVVQRPPVLALLVLLVGVVVGYLVGRGTKRLLEALGVPAMVEGTAFERSAQSLGSSTVAIVARLSSWFVYAIAALAAINIAQLLPGNQLSFLIYGFLPQVFIASFVVMIGFIVADKAELMTHERLRGVKLPELNVLPRLVKYSILYVAVLIALGQVGVNTLALIALLGAYAFALVVFTALAVKDFLSSAAAGVYLLLRQPYTIGDEIQVGDHEGIVQEMNLLVTRVENDEKEYIVPNRKVLEHGVIRIRN